MTTEVYEGVSGARCCIRVGVLPMSRESLEMVRSSAEEALAMHRDAAKLSSKADQDKHKFIDEQLQLLISDIDIELSRALVHQ